MRYLSLEALSHLAVSDLSREAVKKHQDIVMKALNVCSGRENGGREGEGRGREEGGLITRFLHVCVVFGRSNLMIHVCTCTLDTMRHIFGTSDSVYRK